MSKNRFIPELFDPQEYCLVGILMSWTWSQSLVLQAEKLLLKEASGSSFLLLLYSEVREPFTSDREHFCIQQIQFQYLAFLSKNSWWQVLGKTLAWDSGDWLLLRVDSTDLDGPMVWLYYKTVSRFDMFCPMTYFILFLGVLQSAEAVLSGKEDYPVLWTKIFSSSETSFSSFPMTLVGMWQNWSL